jgi:hypothetical protein
MHTMVVPKARFKHAQIMVMSASGSISPVDAEKVQIPD